MSHTTFVVLIGAAILIILGTTLRVNIMQQSGWGFEHPDRGRVEYDNERDCWEDLSNQKDFLPELYGVKCDRRRVPFWGNWKYVEDPESGYAR